MIAREELYVRDERVALPHGQSLARLHVVDHEHELGKLELAPDQRVLHRVPLAGAYVATELPEYLDVAVDALALRLDAELLKPLDDLPHGQTMLGVGSLLEDLLHIEGLELGLVVVRHETLTPSTLEMSDEHMSLILLQIRRFRNKGCPIVSLYILSSKHF